MVVKELLRALKDRMGDTFVPQAIGVITPYAAQVTQLMEMLGNLANEIEIKTVDGFQGHEKDIIVFVPTRCNDDGLIGFLDDDCRINVALTRAKKSLWIVGDAETLRRSQSVPWQALIKHCENLGVLWDLKSALSPELPLWFQKGGKKILSELLASALKGLTPTRGRQRLLAFFAKTTWPIRFSLEASRSLVLLVSQPKLRLICHRLLNAILLDVIGSWALGRSFPQTPEGRQLVLKRQVCIDRTRMTVVASVVLNSQRISQIMQIWDVVDASQVATVDDRVDIFFSRLPSEYRDRCKMVKWAMWPGGDKRRTPVSWDTPVEMAAETVLEVEEGDGRELGVTSAWVNAALRGQANRVTPTDTQVSE